MNVDDYLQIRLLHRDGLSIRQIAKRLGHGRDTIRKAIAEPVPRGYTRSRPVGYPVLGPFVDLIDQILKADESAPRKQRHTAARLYARLRDEHGYLGRYDQVRRYINRHRKQERETHLLLDHPPGARAECDFGHIYVDFPEGRRLVPVLIVVWSNSHYPFAIALPDETCGSILHGLVCAWTFFGAIPAELWCDNPKTLAKTIWRGRDRQLNPNFAALASHYRFAPMFCMPAKGQEKSDVERTVFALQRRFATPVPAVVDVDALNRHLLHCCLKERDRIVSGRTQTIGEMFQIERRHAVELPVRPFDACITHTRQADKYQTVLFEQVRYSVPRQVAFEPVTIKAYLHRIVLVHRGKIVARHQRSRAPGEQVLEPMHFLAVLDRKPAYLDQTTLFKELELPAAFSAARDRFCQQFGERTGTRHYIRLLQLLVSHPADRVAEVIQTCMKHQVLRAEAIIEKISTAGPNDSWATTPAAQTAVPMDASILQRVHVPAPDLRRFDELLHHSYPEGDCDVRPECHVIEEQPQNTAPADDAGRVCQALA